MTSSFAVFKEIIKETRNSSSLYSYLQNVVHPPYDYSDLLRWQWAQSVSALDKLIHDLVRVGMLEIFQGNRAPTSKFLTFPVSLQTHEQMRRTPNLSYSILEQEIVRKHSFLAFQDPDKIADALAYIWAEPHKWAVLAQHFGMTESAIRVQVKNISIRRNQIVHEGDYSSNLLQRQSIVASDVEDVLTFVSSLGEAIYNVIAAIPPAKHHKFLFGPPRSTKKRTCFSAGPFSMKFISAQRAKYLRPEIFAPQMGKAPDASHSAPNALFFCTPVHFSRRTYKHPALCDSANVPRIYSQLRCRRMLFLL